MPVDNEDCGELGIDSWLLWLCRWLICICGSLALDDSFNALFVAMVEAVLGALAVVQYGFVTTVPVAVLLIIAFLTLIF